MRYLVTVIGHKTVAKDFRRLGDKVQDARPAWQRILRFIYGVEKQIFATEGRRGGGSWRRLSPGWTKRKAELHPGANRIGVASGVMRAALTEEGAPHQNIKIQRKQLVFAVALPYIQAQQKHRPVVKFTKKDTEFMRGAISEHLMSAFVRSRRGGRRG